MKNVFKRVVSTVLSLSMVLNIFTTPVLAMGVDTSHKDDVTATMKEPVIVYPIGDESFFKIEDDGSITYTDREVDDGYQAVPSAYILGSEYNKDNISYGIYVTTVTRDDGNEYQKVHIVPMTLCFEDNAGVFWFDHGTEKASTVSVEVDGTNTTDPDMSTQFYLYIENGIDPDGITTEETLKGLASIDPRVAYEVTVQTKGTFQVKATVPMYVCMYGYRGTGNVVTPTSEAYQLKNYSTQNAVTEGKIVGITKLTSFTKIYDEDHSDEKLFSIAFDAETGSYTWWYSDPADDINFDADDYTSYVEIEDLNPTVNEVNASGQVYVIYEEVTKEWSFAPAGLLADGVYRESVNAIDSNYPLKDDLKYKNWNFGKEFKLGDGPLSKIDESMQEIVGMPIRITELQAVPATWRLVDADKHNSSNLLRGELAMTLAPTAAQHDASAIDLADCSAPLDIAARGWYLAAPNVLEGATEVAEGDETTLPLITKALMAGGNVNAEGCTPVVKVYYTVTPVFNADDVVNSEIADGNIEPDAVQYPIKYNLNGGILDTSERGVNITWDGDTNGVIEADGGGWYLLSKKVPTVEQLNNATVEFYDGEDFITLSRAELEVWEDDGCGKIEVYNDDYGWTYALIVPSAIFEFPEAGIYLWSGAVYGESEYVSSFTCGDNSSNPSSYTPANDDISIRKPVRPGYKFMGWYGSNGNVPDTDVTIPSGSTGEKEFTALWEKESYKITYDLRGGSLPIGTSNPTSYTITSKDITLNNPTYDDAVFVGWVEGDGSTPSKSVSIPTGSSGDKHYTAVWQYVVPVGATYTAADGTIYNTGDLMPETVTTGDSYVYGDYEYRYNQIKVPDEGGYVWIEHNDIDGWNMTATNLSKPYYEAILNRINNKPVSKLYKAFAGCSSMVEAPAIPSSVISMEDTFDGCTSLVNAPVIPSSVTNMEGTFSDCTSLIEAPEIPSNVTNMESTFYRCTSLIDAPEIPSSVTDMWSTFDGCTSLVNAPVIPSSVTNMKCTFRFCTSLVNAPVIPSSVISMEDTFSGCTSLIEAPEIPSSVTDMGSAFSGCTSLVNAPVIPSSVTNMKYTFARCTSLIEAPEIPSSVTDMGSAFSGCTSLVNAPVIPSSVTNMGATFSGCISLVNAPVIPSSVTDMGNTFSGCISLVNAPAIPSSVISMGSAFEGCTSLVNAPSISYGVTDMWSTFEGCTLLVNAPVIPSSVKNLNYTFKNCTSLIEAPEIPSSVKNMAGTFSGCISLTGTVKVNANLSTGSSSYYSNCFKDTIKPIKITGSCSSSVKNKLAGTANNGNVTY